MEFDSSARLQCVLVIAMLLAISGCQKMGQPTPAPPNSQTTATPLMVGRFGIVHSPHNEVDTMLIDTATGKTWALAATGDPLKGGKFLWQEVHRFHTPLPVAVPPGAVADSPTTPALGK